MTQTDISTAQAQELEKAEAEQKKFSLRVQRLNAISRHDTTSDNYDRDKAVAETSACIKALGASTGLQEMLAAQLFSIHELQQLSMASAAQTTNFKNNQYYTSTAIKLANCFTQQANLLAKLQSNGSQKMVVEHVTVHSGGQAIVGSINGSASVDRVKK